MVGAAPVVVGGPGAGGQEHQEQAGLLPVGRTTKKWCCTKRVPSGRWQEEMTR